MEKGTKIFFEIKEFRKKNPIFSTYDHNVSCIIYLIFHIFHILILRGVLAYYIVQIIFLLFLLQPFFSKMHLSEK